MFTVYVIQSQTSGKKYTGQTSDLELRLKRHNGDMKSKLTSYTKINKGPWEIIYKEEFNTRQEAIKREKYLKSHAGRDWLNNYLGR
ncbi:GIY-YIG nuclease family protein [Candidatus Curtissbacteria bacterium]|nr:GIY-YIG nuclease family protein [Candidatus Curtissbacteria bacterium]